MSLSADNIWTVLSTCSLCNKALDTDSSPQLLPCCHSSCKDCIDDNKNLLLELTSTISTDKPEFKCKLCLQEYSPDKCIDNYFQQTYWSRNKSDGTHICQSCEGQNKSAVIQCKTCDWICEECQTLHNTIKVFKGHELDETTKMTAPKDMSKNLCPLHNEELTVYCISCRSPFCCRCILKDHNLHVYEDTKDSNQLNQFYNNLTKKVESIKEKRSFAENTLQKFETIETDISAQKEECIAKIKTIVNKLQEKVSDLGTTLLDKVNTVCQQKEQEFNQKKNQLRQMNTAFKYIEDFMAAIMALNEPMGVMRAQDLLNIQLEKLLNTPCNHPDFITAFKIHVKDALSDPQSDSNGFDVSKMIDGVFNMCFKIETSDDRKEEVIHTNSVNAIEYNAVDDEVSIIGVTKSNTPPIRPAVHYIQSASHQQPKAAKAQTFRAASPVVNQRLRSVLPTIIRGNSREELSRLLTNRMPSHLTSNALSVPPQHFHNTPHSQALTSYANSMQTSQSLPQMQNNFMPQTGILLGQSYGSPQVYRAPATNQSAQNLTAVNVSTVSTPVTLYNYINTQNAPNVTIRPNQQQVMQTIGVNGRQFITISRPSSLNHFTQSNAQSGGTTQPTVVFPSVANQQTPNSTILAQLARSTNTILNNQSQSAHLVQQQRNTINRLEMEKRREIQRIEQDLRDTSPPFPSDPLAQRVIEILNNENISESQTAISDFQNTIAKNTNANTNTYTNASSCGPIRSAPDRTYQLHIPENTMTPTEPESTASRDSVIQNSTSETSNSSPPVITPQSAVSSVRNDSSNSCEQTTSPSLPQPIQSAANNCSQVNKEKTNQNDNSVQNTPRPAPEETEELILPHFSNPPSVGSLFSELSNEPFPEIIDSNSSDNNKEESQEKTSSSAKPTAPVARIAPITNDSETSLESYVGPEIVEIDDFTDDEAIDEDADCVVCSKEYGEFICCSQCPRAFHIECHVPELKKMPETSFICTFCKSLDEMVVSSRTRKSGLNDIQLKICEKVLLHLLCNKKSQDFKPPASDSIQQTLNLNIIKKKLEKREFENEIQFIDDIKRLFTRYKNRDITPEVMAEYNTFERYFKKIVHKLMPSFSEALQNNTSINNCDPSSSSAAKRTKSNCISV